MTQQRSNPGDLSPSEEETGGGFDLAHLIGVVSEARWFIAGVTASILLIGTLYAFLRPPAYKVDTVLHVLAQQSGGLSGLEQFSALIQGSAIPTDTEIQLLQTRAVLVPVIQQLHLDINVDGGFVSSLLARVGLGCPSPAVVSLFDVPPALEGERFKIERLSNNSYRLLDPGGNTVLESRVGLPAMGRVQADSGPGLVSLKVESLEACAGTFSLTKTAMDQEIKYLLKKLDIEEEGLQTGIVDVTLRGQYPELIATTVNAIAETNVRENIRQNASQAADQLTFVNAQLPGLRNQLIAAQGKLAVFLNAHPTLAALSQSTEYLVTQTSALDQQIAPLQAQMAQAHASLGPRNPQLSVLQSQLDSLQQQRSQLLNGIAKLPEDQQTLARLQMDVTADNSLYTAMLNQVQTLQITKAGTVSDVVIVDHALLPSQPDALPNIAVIILSLVVGLLFGVFAAFPRRALRRGIEDPEEINNQLGLSVYAVLPHCSVQRKLERQREAAVTEGASSILAAVEPQDQTTEALRSLRTALQLAMPRSGPRILCMNSLGPGEGKSFLASNLGYLFAQGGTRVLLVDADMRRGHLHRVFGWRRGKGLSDVLQGTATIDEVVRKTPQKMLDVVTTGTVPEDAANILVQHNIGKVMEQFAANYDLVIADVPPVLAVGDALIIGSHATLNLLVLKYGLHSLSQVRFALKRFKQHNIQLEGCVLNDVSISAQRYAYNNYGYQYQYQYK